MVAALILHKLKLRDLNESGVIAEHEAAWAPAVDESLSTCNFA